MHSLRKAIPSVFRPRKKHADTLCVSADTRPFIEVGRAVLKKKRKKKKQQQQRYTAPSGVRDSTFPGSTVVPVQYGRRHEDGGSRMSLFSVLTEMPFGRDDRATARQSIKRKPLPQAYCEDHRKSPGSTDQGRSHGAESSGLQDGNPPSVRPQVLIESSAEVSTVNRARFVERPKATSSSAETPKQSPTDTLKTHDSSSLDLDEEFRLARQRYKALKVARKRRDDELEAEETAKHEALDKEWRGKSQSATTQVKAKARKQRKSQYRGVGKVDKKSNRHKRRDVQFDAIRLWLEGVEDLESKSNASLAPNWQRLGESETLKNKRRKGKSKSHVSSSKSAKTSARRERSQAKARRTRDDRQSDAAGEASSKVLEQRGIKTKKAVGPGANRKSCGGSKISERDTEGEVRPLEDASLTLTVSLPEPVSPVIVDGDFDKDAAGTDDTGPARARSLEAMATGKTVGAARQQESYANLADEIAVLVAAGPGSPIGNRSSQPHMSDTSPDQQPHPAAWWLDEAEELFNIWRSALTAAGGQPQLHDLPIIPEEGSIAAPEQEIPLPVERDCIVCGDSTEPLAFPAQTPTATCEHMPQTCSDCLASWMASEVETKGTEGIKCPECPKLLTYNDVQRAASPATFTIYERLTVRAALGSLPNFAWCLSSSCDAGQENVPDANFMECLACGYRQCLTHRIPWHDEETCELYEYRISGQQARDEEERRRAEDQRKRKEASQRQREEEARRRREQEEQRRRAEQKRNEERLTNAMLDSVSKKCPNPWGCGWRIQKISGCDHMTCRRCRWEFCWICLASQDAINDQGNTAHQRSCPYA